MLDYSYGVVVEDSNPNYNIWLLFKGIDSTLTTLDGTKCQDALRVGTIVQACTDTEDGETRIRSGWPYPDSIWSDKGRVVIRTIVSYNADVTIERGKWIDETSNIFFVNLISRDIGIVLAPTPWYNREFFGSNECHMLVYAEFRPQRLVSAALPETHCEFFWSIIEDRLSLPVRFPSKDLEPDRFLEPDEIRKVPVITVLRQSNGWLVWSYGLGNRMAIILANHEGLNVGQWLMATVIRTSPGDLLMHGCTYTVVQCEAAIPYSQPNVQVVDETIQMVLTLSRREIEPGNPAAGVRLWHEFWGLQVGYGEGTPEWVRGENGHFKGVVEIGVSTEDEFEGRRVSIKAIGPAAGPQVGKGSAALAVDDYASLKDLSDLKKALLLEEEEEQLTSKGAEPTGRPTNQSLNDANNNNNDDWYPADQTVSSAALSNRSMQNRDDMRNESAGSHWGRGMRDPWGNGRTKELSNTPEQKKNEGLNWRNAGKEESKEKREYAMRERAAPVIEGEGGIGRDGIIQYGQQRGAYAIKGRGEGRGLWKDLSNPHKFNKTSSGPGSGTDSGPGPFAPAQDPGSEGIGFGAASRIPMQEAMAMPAPIERQYQGAPPIADLPSGDPVKPKQKSGFESENIVDPVPIRAFDDKKTERMWKKEMMTKGWEFPKEREEIVIPDGEDGWEQYGAKDFGVLVERVKPPMPVENLISKRTIVRDALRLKLRQCIITRVRFDFHWRYAEKVQLFILDGTPAYIVHNMNRPVGHPSYLKALPEFTTVGNVVELHVGRSMSGFYVHDEMWRLVQKVQLPMREIVFEPGRTKSLELIVNCRCLCPDAQDRHNDRHRYNRHGFTMLNDYILHNIAYYGRNIDAREHEDYTFQIVVMPEEVLEGHAFWKATEVLWRVQVEKIPENAWMPDPSLPPPRQRSPLPPRAPVHVELKKSVNEFMSYADERQKGTIARETRLEELFTLYGKLLENDRLMTELHKRTGTDYKKKLRSAIEVGQTAMPHKKSMKRELQINADFLVSIVENAYTEELFREMGERRLWKNLVKTSDSIKAFRNTVNNR